MLIFKLIVHLANLGAVFGVNRMRYVVTEHPEVTWFNPKYLRNVNLTARRYGRSDPFYYIGLNFDIIWPIKNNMNVDFYFYEFLTNQYKPSFVELHFAVCDLIAKDVFFGISFRKFFPHPCPIEPGIYKIENITVPLKNIPENFPFTKGRAQGNFTSRDTHELLGFGHVDMEIKEVSVRRTKNQNQGKKNIWGT